MAENVASPPDASRTSESRTRGTQRSSSMLGSAVSSGAPRDFHPSSHMGSADRPLMKRQTPAPGPTPGCPYIAVGMQRALDSAIGLPGRSTNASRMLAFLMPAEVRSNFNGFSFACGVGVVLPSEGLSRGTRIIARPTQ